MPGKKDQKLLQLAAGLLMILAVIGVEWMAVRPVGIYLYSDTGAEPFAPGMNRQEVLSRLNDVKSIREVMTCAPDSDTALASRKGFSMTRQMDQSRSWTLWDRQKGVYWLRFDSAGPKGRVDRVLFLNDPDKDGQSDFLFSLCDPEFFTDPEAFISTRTGYAIFPS